MSEQKAVVRKADIPNMGLEDLKKLDPETLARAVIQYQRKDVAVLGDGEAFVIRTGDGTIQAVKVAVKLRLSAKHIYAMSQWDPKTKKMVDLWSITAKGYDELNKVATLSPNEPDTLTGEGGRVLPNPWFDYIMKDGNRELQGVKVRMQMIGYSPTGTLAVSNTTLYYDVPGYFKKDIIKKMKKYPDMVQIMPDNLITDEMRASSYIKPFREGLSLIIDFTHPEFAKVVVTVSDAEPFFQRKAMTIARRNCLRVHPAFGGKSVVHPQQEGNDWVVVIPMIGWRHMMNQEQLNNVANKLSHGEELPNVKVYEVPEAVIDDDDVDIDMEIDEEEAKSRNEEPMPNQQPASNDQGAAPPAKDLFAGSASPSQKMKALEKTYGTKAVDKAIQDSHPEGLVWKDIKQSDRMATINSAAKKLGEVD